MGLKTAIFRSVINGAVLTSATSATYKLRGRKPGQSNTNLILSADAEIKLVVRLQIFDQVRANRAIWDLNQLRISRDRQCI